MPAATIGVLALQGDIWAHVSALRALDADVLEVRLPADLARVDALVLPGGESTAVALLLGSSGLRGPLDDRLRAGLPAFGTCAGMILLARDVVDGRPDQPALGAIDINVRRNGFGTQAHSFEADLDVADVPGGPLHAVFIRAPVIETVGPDVDVLAEFDGRPVVVRQGPVLACSFHPELVGDLRLHNLFLNLILNGGLSDVRPLEMGDDQAPEGGQGQGAQQAVRQADPPDRGVGPRGRG